MKKIIALITLLMLVLSLAACAKHDCGTCGAEGEGKHKVTFGDEKVYLCDDCKDIYEASKSLLGF